MKNEPIKYRKAQAKGGCSKSVGFAHTWRADTRMEGAAVPRKTNVCRDGYTVQYTTLKVRLYPTPAQAELFEKTFGCCRYIWNQMLSDQQRFYLETDAHFIPTPAKYKNEAPFLKEVDNQALTQEYNKPFGCFSSTLRRLDTPISKRKKQIGIPSPPVTTSLNPAPPSIPQRTGFG